MQSNSLQDISPNGGGVETERRRAHRAEFVVRVGYATVDEFFSDFTRDINEGGLFIETDAPCPVGTEIALSFRLPGTDKTVETTGRVVRATEESPWEPAGMGIEFDSLGTEVRTQIDELVRSLRIGALPRTAA